MKRKMTVFQLSFLFGLILSCQEAALVENTQDCIISETLESEEKGIVACNLPEQETQADLELNVTLNDFNIKQEDKMRRALEQLKIVLNSKEFKEKILNYEYQGIKQFVDNNGLSNTEIYNAIQDGAEDLLPEIDREIDLDVTLYYANNSTVGYTYANVNKIWVNNKFFSGNSLAKVAENVVHEWTHKLGFGHDFRRTTRRNDSVPYGVGKIVREMIQAMSLSDPEGSQVAESDGLI